MAEAGAVDRGARGADALWGGALVLALLPGFRLLSQAWDAVDYLSHSYVVPLVSLWLARDVRRARGAALPREPLGRAGVALAAALLLYLLGLASADATLAGLGAVGAVSALVWLRAGTRWLAALAFPLGFLLFAVPPPLGLLTPLILQLQLLVSQTAVALLGAFAIPVLREGNVLTVRGGESLFVAEACSGVTSIVTLLPLGALLGYLALRRNGLRLALVAAVVPLAMLGNLGRVALTVALADRFGVEAVTQGTLHTGLGLLVYAVACGGLLGVAAGLARWERRAAGPAR